MSQVLNTTPLQNLTETTVDESSAQTMVKVDSVSMVFNMASEQLNSLKEYAIALARNELRFKELRALDNVSFEVKKGDVFGILGTNGSGKSTMLKIIAGVLTPSEGSVEIKGNIAPLIELGAGFDLELTARENIYLNGALLGYPKKFIDENFDEIVSFAEIEQFLDMPMKNYSSGMVARVAFAIATVIVPDILIVDEVLSVGDFMFQQKCERRISKLIKEHNVTVLIVSHSNDQIERLCNKAIWIEKGHTRMMGTAKEVCRTYRVLGGHSGNAESEQHVFEMLNENVTVPANSIKTILADDRYGSAIKLNGSVAFEGNCAVVASGDDPSACLIGAGLASSLNSPLIPSKQSNIPDVATHYLKQLSPNTVYMVHKDGTLTGDVVSHINELVPSAKIIEITSDTVSNLALETYCAINDSQWGDTAIITWDGCTGDVVSLLPFSCRAKAPLFFNVDSGVIDRKVIDLITSGPIERLLVLGGQKSFPDACLEPFVQAGIEIVRFCGKDPYDANEKINNWIESQAELISQDSHRSLIVASIWNPYDVLAAGPFANTTNSLILLEDPQNLDSVSHAIEYVKKNQSKIDTLRFLGDHTRFTELDRSLLGKALAYKDESNTAPTAN